MKNVKAKWWVVWSMVGLLFLSLVAGLSLSSYSAFAQTQKNIKYVRNVLSQANDIDYIEVFGENGFIETTPLPDAYFNSLQSYATEEVPSFNEQKIYDSGRPDSDSIVITIMGDGFTASQQSLFIEAAKKVTYRMLGDPNGKEEGSYPFNMFRDYFTVYAIEVISNESGVSRDADTNNNVIVDNYFGSSFYYGESDSDIERALVIGNYSRAYALEKPNSSLTTIICNSKRWGGTGGAISVISMHDNNDWTMLHEAGHTFGNLADEYYYPSDGPFRGYEAPNRTQDNNPSTIKWKNFLGTENVGIYPYSTGVDKNDPNFDSSTDLWFKPHTNCKMQVSNQEFCPVCESELLKKMGKSINRTPTVSLDLRYNNLMQSTTATLGEPLDAYSLELTENTGYDFDGYYTQIYGNGMCYYKGEITSSPVGYPTSHPFYELTCTGKIWDIPKNTTLYANWKPLTTEQNVNVNIEVHDSDGSVGRMPSVVGATGTRTHNQSVTLEAPSVDGYKFLRWELRLYYNDTVALTNSNSEFNYTVELLRTGDYNAVTYRYDVYAIYEEEEGCIAPNTLITLADGRQVPVENLTGNEMLLVWNLQKGCLDTAPILFIDTDPNRMFNVINLVFSDGTTVKVISEHGFWDCDLNKYIYLDRNAANYIGHWFLKSTDNVMQKVQLTEVTITNKMTTAYSPVTAHHLCYFVNGMLSMPGGINGLFNIFEVDASTMKYDEVRMQADIAKYGLYTYDEFCGIVAVSEEVFDVFNGKYLRVAVGKGLITVDEIAELVRRYEKFFSNL